MSRRTSSIVVPSFCLILSACPEDDAPSGVDDLGTSGESSSETDSSGDGDGAGDGDGDGDTAEGDGDGDTTGAASCPPEGPFGTEVGDTIDDLVFFRQNGDPIGLHSACGLAQPALIIFGTASW